MANNAREISRSTEEEVFSICDEICRITGVQLGENQRRMVLSRLLRRAISLGIPELDNYISYYRLHKKAENEALVSILTTHHTAFFREAAHFQYLESTGLAKVVQDARERGEKRIRILSAACSRGQECYTLSMLLAHHLPKIVPDFSFEIVGMDVDPESIAIAKNGVYFRNEIKVVPIHYLANHWTGGTKDVSEYVKANASIQKHCTFLVDNLLKSKRVADSDRFDIIFCRNVFIYFTPEQIASVTTNLIGQMHFEGLLFIGMSESLSQLNLPLEGCGPSIYSKARKTVVAPQNATTVQIQTTKAPSPVELIRVLCVDDSPAILMILKKILNEKTGFRVVATAANGIEAAEALTKNKVDVVTLDIHMPKEDGLTYLKRNYSASHPPVVILSSVSRDDSDLAINCFKSGAADYVEKPALGEIEERAEEICIKLRCALFARASEAPSVNVIDATFATKTVITDVSEKLRIILANFGDRERVAAALTELAESQPPTFVVIEGAGNPIKSIVKEIAARVNRTVEFYDDSLMNIADGSIYVSDAAALDRLALKYGARKTSILIFGEATAKSVAKLARFSQRSILAEENYRRQSNDCVLSVANDIVPSTSFIHMSNFYLSRRGI